MSGTLLMANSGTLLLAIDSTTTKFAKVHETA